MVLGPPRYRRTDTLFPDTTLVRSAGATDRQDGHRTCGTPRCPYRLPAAPCHVQCCSAANPRLLWRRSEEHTSELQSLTRVAYAVFCLNNKPYYTHTHFACRLHPPTPARQTQITTPTPITYLT